MSVGLRIAVALAVGATSVAAGNWAAEPRSGGSQGKARFEEHCTRCHPASRALAVRKASQGWTRTVERMSTRNFRTFGYELLGEEQRAVVEHLLSAAGTRLDW